MTRLHRFSPLFALLLLTPLVAHAQYDEERMIDRRFNVAADGWLRLNVHDADVQVRTSDTREAHVEVFLRSRLRNMDRARDYYEEQHFSVSSNDNTVYVETDPPRRFNWSWERSGGAQILVRVVLPKHFNLDLQTGDGDVELEPMEGRISVRSSDGDVRTSTLSGPEISLKTSDGDIYAGDLDSEEVAIQTSDGDITLKDIAADVVWIKTSDGSITGNRFFGEAEVNTSDGDIRIRSLEGRTLSLRTSDGEITTDALKAQRVTVHSSDGELDLGTVEGNLRATTSGGDIAVTLVGQHEVFLRSSDGDITITAPFARAMDLELKGDRVRVDTGFDFDGTVKKEYVRGRVGRGGPLVEARTSDGTVVLRGQ